MKGGAKDLDKKAFLGLNKLLGKIIIENSLVLMKCVKGDKGLGYFPLVNEIKGGYSSVYNEFYKSYPGIKPKFVNIFNGEGVLENMRILGLLNADSSVNWDRLVHKYTVRVRFYLMLLVIRVLH